MLIVYSGLRQKEIIELVSQIRIEDKQVFAFHIKEGIQLRFNQLIEYDKSVELVKETIKDSSFGRALNFNVESK